MEYLETAFGAHGRRVVAADFHGTGSVPDVDRLQAGGEQRRRGLHGIRGSDHVGLFGGSANRL